MSKEPIEPKSTARKSFSMKRNFTRSESASSRFEKNASLGPPNPAQLSMHSASTRLPKSAATAVEPAHDPTSR